MGARYNPKTLVKTLSYIAVQEPGEHGLFWDLDGTMPWKELFWALQEDASLRFVRESTIRELTYLGLELPFVLEGNLVRLKPGSRLPDYSSVMDLPHRLYLACRRKQYALVKEHGVTRSNRSYIAVSGNRELAMRLGKRRDAEPLLLEVLAAGAAAEGEPIRRAGADLYLMESIPVRHLIFPLLRAPQQAVLTSRKKVDVKPSRPDLPLSAGSFLMDAEHLRSQSAGGVQENKAKRQKGGRKNDWKREAKKERHKRSV